MKSLVSTLLKRSTLMVTSFILAISSLSAAMPLFLSQTANAVGTVNISSVPELCNAIDNQADGQTWTIEAGTYGLGQCNSILAGGQTGWYMPITKNDITINGVGNPTIYGTGYTANGAWATQNLISVFGDNVTINGLTLMPKVQPNKTIEVLGSNFTLTNTVITPNTIVDSSVFDNSMAQGMTKAEAQQWGGSIYFSHEGNHTLQNVTINNGGVSFRYSPTGTHINFDNVNIVDTTNIDWINSYRYSSAFNNSGNSTVGLPSVYYHVNSTIDNLDSVLLGAQSGDRVLLDSDITVPNQKNISKKIVFDGQGNTVYVNGSGYRFLITANGTIFKNMDIVKTDKVGVQNIIGVQASDVSVDNVNFTGQYVLGDGDVSRALEISGDNFAVTNSSFSNLRQPAYVNSFNGSVSNSFVNGTKGWVLVADSNVHFTGNTWGVNATDIAIIDNDGNPSTAVTNNYTCVVMAQIRADNNNPTIDNQVATAACPPVLTVVVPSTGQYVSTKANSNKLKITGSFTDDVKANYATFQLVHNGSSVAIGTIYGYGSVFNPAATYAAADGSYTYNLPVPANLADGDYSLFYIGTDFEGGITNRMERTFVIDNTKPHVTGSVESPFNPLSFTITAIDGFGTINKITGNIYDATTNVLKKSNSSTLNPFQVDLSTLTDGNYYVKYNASDTAGNVSNTEKFYFTVDHAKPTISASLSDTLINFTDTNPVLTVNASDPGSGIAYTQYSIMDSTMTKVLGWFTIPGNTTDTVDVSSLSDGDYTVRARAFDNAGNKKSGADVAFTIDRTLPVASITTTGTQSTATPTINGTVGADAVSLVFTIDDVVQPITWTSGSTTWTSTPTSDLFEGPHSMKIVATDPAGNEGGQTGTITISVPAPLITPLATTTGGGTGTPTPPAPQATVTPGEVLGDQTTTDDAAKTGDSNVNPSASILGDATSNPMNLFGLAWYWWLAILAAIISAWWIIAAALRRRDNQNV